MNLIQEFKDEFRFLSNFYSSPVKVDGILYPTAEHAYQAQKTLDENRRREIANLPSPGAAKKEGRKLLLRKDWEYIKFSVMYRVVLNKFRQNSLLAKMLLETKDIWLVEGNRWGDEIWGKCLKKNQGDNWLGRILMLVRSQLQEENSYVTNVIEDPE